MRFNQPKFILTLLASLFIFSQVFSQKEKEWIAGYVQQYKDLAMAEMLRTGIPASITLAQGLLETAYGQSELALYANNHFGIKCKKEWAGDTMLHDDDAKGECFRKYANAEDSYKDHSEFLRNGGRYAFLFKIPATDYAAWAKGLKMAGYATSPTYAQRLVSMIEENNLQDYTLLALQQKAGNDNATASASPTPPLMKDMAAFASESFLDPASNVKKVVVKTKMMVDNSGYPAGEVFLINGLKVLLAPAGTSLFAIAGNYNIVYKKLLEFNDLDEIDILDKDELIFLQKKQKRGKNEIHVAEANESLRDICQKEGVQLKSLLAYNRLQKDAAIAVGDKIYLRAMAPVTGKLAENNGKRDNSRSTSMR
jgi:hypothetical protein